MHEIRDMEKMAEREAAKPKNRYDKSDIVRRVFLMNAEGLKFASYRVRDVAALYKRNEEVFSSLQHHLTYVPVQSLGGMMLVNEIGATIYAMLEDEQALHLAEVITKVEALGDDFDATSFVDLEKSHTVISAYWQDDKIEFQIIRGSQILGVLPIGVAKMFCTLAQRARDGVPSLADREPPTEAAAAGIAGEVDKALNEPLEQIDPDTFRPIGTPEVDGKKLGDALRGDA